MSIKMQSLSVTTLFASAVASFLQIIITVLGFLSPFFLLPVIGMMFDEQVKYGYLQNIVEYYRVWPMVLFGEICMLIAAILFTVSYKKIKKGKNVKLWAIISLIVSLLIMNFGPYGYSTIFILGLIGSISGLMYKEELK